MESADLRSRAIVKYDEGAKGKITKNMARPKYIEAINEIEKS